MARAGWSDTGIAFDDSGGTPRTMTAYILLINGIDINAVLEDNTPMGAEWEAQVYAGHKSMADIVLEGLYDDTASVGPKVVFDAVGDTRTFTITYRSGKTTSVETIITKYGEPKKTKATTRFKVTLRPTGTPTEV